MKIRRAGPDDRGAVADLYVQLRRHHVRLAPSNPRYAMAEENWTRYAEGVLASDSKRVYVAQEGPTIVGFVCLFFAEKPWGRACEIETLVVDEDARGKAVGTKLMRRAEEVAREEGALAMRVDVLHTNVEGRRFYEADGYRTIAVRYGKPL